MRADGLGRLVGGSAVLVATALIGPACQVRGLIGSNETAVRDTTDPGTSDTEPVDPRSPSTGRDAEDEGPTGGGESTRDGDRPTRFDVQAADTADVCAPPPMTSCDGEESSWWTALGLGCDEYGDGEFSVDGSEASRSVHRGGLGNGSFAPREGERMVILSTGLAADVPLTPEELIANDPTCDAGRCPNTWLGGERQFTLPDPISMHPVPESRSCGDDPTLVGRGDCSNSLAEHWARGEGAFDYSELRLRLEVPANTDAFQYDFAFFSSEYPLFVSPADRAFNDMYIAWLESENWTGNISFDGDGNPITVQSVFMDHRSRSDVCPTCEAPELEGFSMAQHAGTKWLTSVASVVPGEEIELIFVVLDLSDPYFDTFVLLDNFRWTCTDGPPVTSVG